MTEVWREVDVNGDSVWECVGELASAIGYETFFEPQTVSPPPVFCEPQTPNHVADPDFGWPHPKGVEPDVDDPQVCRAHDEWWPCAAVRTGRPAWGEAKEYSAPRFPLVGGTCPLGHRVGA